MNLLFSALNLGQERNRTTLCIEYSIVDLDCVLSFLHTLTNEVRVHSFQFHVDWAEDFIVGKMRFH